MSAPSALAGTDEDLVRCCRGDPKALDELIDRYENRVRRCAERMALGRADAEDLVQESFLRLWLALPSFQARSGFGTWVYAIAHNTCIDAARRQIRKPRVQSLDRLSEGGDEPAADRLVDEEFEAQVRECLIGRALASLPLDYREILRLRIGEGLSSQATARRLATSVESVKGKLKRARTMLRSRLSQPSTCPLCQGLGSFRVVPEPTVRRPAGAASPARTPRPDSPDD